MELYQGWTVEEAKLKTGGKRLGNIGFIVELIFSYITDNMSIVIAETFGTVQSTFQFRTLDEAYERANATSYDLTTGIITKDRNEAVETFEAGTV